MGLFGSISSIVSSGIKAVGRAVGKGIEKVGYETGHYSMVKLGQKIQDACSEKVAQEKSYEKQNADIYSTERLNEILVSFSEGYYQQATAIEKACIESVENYFISVVGILENSSAQIQNDINLKRVKRAKNNIMKKIDGAVKNPLAKRMSLDDSECLRILKLDAGEEKKRAMTSFTQKVINEALANLSRQVRESLDEQMEGIEDYLVNLSEEQEKEFSNLKRQYTKMWEASQIEGQEQEWNCVEPLIALGLADKIEKILV